MKQIIGPVFRPCFMTIEELEEVVKKQDNYTDKDFLEKYKELSLGMSHVAESAKLYILREYKNVKDWTKLEVTILDATRKETEYYIYTDHRQERMKNRKEKAEKSARVVHLKGLEKFEEELKAKHNPIVTVTDFVLDPTDGDFSVTINGRPHLWIDDESIIIIANYIETQLKENDNTKN